MASAYHHSHSVISLRSSGNNTSEDTVHSRRCLDYNHHRPDLCRDPQAPHRQTPSVSRPTYLFSPPLCQRLSWWPARIRLQSCCNKYRHCYNALLRLQRPVLPCDIHSLCNSNVLFQNIPRGSLSGRHSCRMCRRLGYRLHNIP